MEYRYPNLRSVIMIEQFVETQSGQFGKKQLWQLLPKKMMYSTYQVAFEYLITSRKIFVNEDDKIEWVVYKEV